NRYEWVVLQYAAARVGAILVNINPAYRPAELQYALEQSGSSLLVLARKFRQTDYVEMLNGVRSRWPELREAVVFDDDWDRVLADGDHMADVDLSTREASLEFDDPVNIQYTSGTTGSPKGATLTHHNILNNGYFGGGQIHLTEHDRVCSPVPLYHCFGCVLGT